MNEAVGIIVAAGSGTRMGQGAPKQFRLLGGKPTFHWSIEAFAAARGIDSVIVVVPPDDVRRVQQELATRFPSGFVRDVVAGGSTRSQSVSHGLARAPAGAQWVLVHDAARPLASSGLVERVLVAAKEHGAATAAEPLADTIKQVDEAGVIVRTLERAGVWRIQTPQGFRKDALMEAHRLGDAAAATDDAQLVEAMGMPVRVVRGEPANIKITTEDDWKMVKALAKAFDDAPRPSIATGFGFDVHRLVEGRPLILGGVDIPHALGLAGHSDADVLAHAVTDAIFGAATLGDLGSHFPDTDPAYAGADSLELLRQAVRMASARGVRILHVDAFVSAEAPKLKPHVDAMRRNLAAAMGIAVDAVNVKAGTGEGCGPVGRGEAMEARAVVTVERRA